MAAAHFHLGVLLRDPASLGEAVVLRPVFSVPGVGFRIDELKISLGLDAQAVAVYATLDHRGSAHEDELREAFVDHDLCRSQHALVLAL